jgi:DNA topoisomerase-1
MTRTLDAHMQLIKQSQRTREDVVRESRQMLHAAFDQLEAHEGEIGDEIRNRTAEEMTLGKCPVCGTGTLGIKHLRGSTQFIGCSRYPDCTFNIGLPVAQWGFAVRTDETCKKHNLSFVRLVRKGARPWDIGCPLCHHINTNRESLAEIPTLSPEKLDRLESLHIYSVADLARSKIPWLMTTLDLPQEKAEQLVRDAGVAMELLRKRSECRKFMRETIAPRKGRSYAAILKTLKEAGISDIAGLARADAKVLRDAGISEKEAGDVIAGARVRCGSTTFKKIGIPGPSIRKYIAAGVLSPEEFCSLQPQVLAEKAGISPATVYRHTGLVCAYLNRPAPVRVNRTQAERGRKELLAIRGLTESAARKLFIAGIQDGTTLIAADPRQAAAASGMPEETIRAYQALARKRRENAIIEI